MSNPEASSEATIIFLNGCFWGSEYALRELPVQTEVGYAGGTSTESPTYYNLDHSGHSEAVKVSYDPATTQLAALLEIMTMKSAGDPSPGTNPRYRRGILCSSAAQAACVENFRDAHGYDFEIAISTLFHRAEPYHQRYYERTLAD